MVHKLKIKPKKYKPIQKTNYWFRNICGKNITNLGKYQHLKTEIHKCNLHNLPPPPIRRLKKREDYVENKPLQSTSTKSYNWFWDQCGKHYTLINKKQHLKTKKHMRNEFKQGGGILDLPIESDDLPEPLVPTPYVPKRPVPKPRRHKIKPLPLPKKKKNTKKSSTKG